MSNIIKQKIGKIIIIIKSWIIHKGFCDECKQWFDQDLIADENEMYGNNFGICLNCLDKCYNF